MWVKAHSIRGKRLPFDPNTPIIICGLSFVEFDKDMDGECSTCTQLWRLYAQAADDLWKTGAALQTAGLAFDHNAVKGGITGLREAARARDRVERQIVQHELQAHSDGGDQSITDLAPIRLADVERAHIELIVAETKGNLSKASRILNIDRSTLYTKLRSYGLK